MFKTYVILAHKNPEQLKSMINILNDENSFFIIHIDLKSDVKIFSDIVTNSNVYFLKNRVDCIWGDYSQVTATINLFREAIKLKSQNDSKIILLSGQDFPIKKISLLNNYLSGNNDANFISFILDPISEKNEEFERNFLTYKINLSSKKGDFILTKGFFTEDFYGKLKLLYYLLKGKITLQNFRETFFKRKPYFKQNYKGPQWFILRNDTMERVLDFIDSEEESLSNYYKYTLCADEHFFHTIIKNLDRNGARIKTLPYLHYIDWSRESTELPVVFTMEDYGLLINQPQNKFFARKFDIHLDPKILQEIAKNIRDN